MPKIKLVGEKYSTNIWEQNTPYLYQLRSAGPNYEYIGQPTKL